VINDGKGDEAVETLLGHLFFILCLLMSLLCVRLSNFLVY